ncbi:MAG: FKBP-type peptidyl-prolyl cis-trans isomerase [Treponema sp.]|jgi:FKBP-type peptidyl-prolyl cis-trans isomerase|nr:FKBP-type peptidyl-prolyl cis-trans isomerase [Treponema sp.]
MKKLTVILCLFFAVTTIHARAIQEDYAKADEKARVSYAFGMVIGSNLDLSTLGIQFDYAAFADGLKAIIEGNSQFSEIEAIEIIEAALQAVMDNRAIQHRLQEEEFLAMNSLRPEIQVTESGLQYEILVYTEGEKPKADSVVRVHYSGTFMDGSLFDSSIEADGSYIPLELVIQGWTEGLMLMSPGSHFRLYIPSYLAYGSDGIQGIILPYSTLIFSVELLEIVSEDDTTEEESEF